ncbi:hypothetical protein M8C21_012719, partial [Ambrosia artemisiifolia]
VLDQIGSNRAEMGSFRAEMGSMRADMEGMRTNIRWLLESENDRRVHLGMPPRGASTSQQGGASTSQPDQDLGFHHHLPAFSLNQDSRIIAEMELQVVFPTRTPSYLLSLNGDSISRWSCCPWIHLRTIACLLKSQEPLFDYSPVPFFIKPKSSKISPSKLIHLTSAAVATISTKRGSVNS